MAWLSKKRALKLEKLENEKREREIRARINIKRTLSMMKKQSSKLDSFKRDYVEKARQASVTGNIQTYKLAKSGLKLCLSKQKFLDTMIANFEISIQINDMNQVIGEFVKGMNIISDQMKNITSTLDMTKAQAAYDRALENNAGQYEALDAFLTTAVDSIETLDDFDGNISDDEIDKLISNQILDSEDETDKEIDEKIKMIREKITH
ncbi:MAG: hypothetical protein C4537_00370 [Acholeplasma sp.]|jgi:hypothetical protein|nr:MAG: hypothetical protein C4537_00370 [Acholeplasma sp.]